MDDKVLEKIRALLAKAEATDFPEEARSLSEKAQQLMVRHAIDAATLEAARKRGVREEVEQRTIFVQNPYSKPKVVLLHEVARANRCQVVMSEARKGTNAYIVGFPSDLESVELLFTSLLLQSSREMLSHPFKETWEQIDTWSGEKKWVRTDGNGDSTYSFRKSFMLAYAREIGKRLRATVADEIEHNPKAIVLVGREDEVKAKFREMFPNLGSANIGRQTSWAGVRAGKEAAQKADLGRPRVGSRKALQ